MSNEKALAVANAALNMTRLILRMQTIKDPNTETWLKAAKQEIYAMRLNPPQRSDLVSLGEETLKICELLISDILAEAEHLRTLRPAYKETEKNH